MDGDNIRICERGQLFAPFVFINGDAAESFRVNLWLKWSLFFSINESVSYLYRSAAEPAMCNHHLGLLFHMCYAGDLQAFSGRKMQALTADG